VIARTPIAGGYCARQRPRGEVFDGEDVQLGKRRVGDENRRQVAGGEVGCWSTPMPPSRHGVQQTVVGVVCVTEPEGWPPAGLQLPGVMFAVTLNECTAPTLQAG